MIKQGYNVTRKEYFHAITVPADNAEKDFSLFNTNSGSANLTDMDTNWPSADNSIPGHLGLKITRFGFSAIGADYAPLTAAVLAKIAKGIVTVKIGSREVKQGTLGEFFKLPGAVSGTLQSDFSTGPNYKDILEEEAIPGDVVDFKIHLPAAIGAAVRFIAHMDTITSAKL